MSKSLRSPSRRQRTATRPHDCARNAGAARMVLARDARRKSHGLRAVSQFKFRSADGLCNAAASSTGPVSHVSHSSAVVKSTGIALPWIGRRREARRRYQKIHRSRNFDPVLQLKFKHKGLDYETLAIVDLFDNVVRVEIFHNAAPVILTSTDGSQDTRRYDVDLSTRMAVAQDWDCEAVEDMMNTAETDLKAIVR